jgi:drug/metabolite transporter (DMT)-like permease
MAMKMCDDLRSGLPMLLLLFYLGVLCLFLETQLQWQKELDVPPSDGMLDHAKTWSGLILLAASAVGLFMVIVYDHTGIHRQIHGVGVLLMLLGLAGVYGFTAVYESTCNLRMHAQRHELTYENMLGLAHLLTVVLFALCVVLFVLAWCFDHLPLAVLSEYILLVLIVVLAVICMVELAALQHAATYKAVPPDL